MNLRGETVFSLVDFLIDAGVAVVFATDYERGALTRCYDALPACFKPLWLAAVTQAIETARRT